MIDSVFFREWLKNNTSYSQAVVGDIVSRVKRADSMLEWYEEEVYQFYLERTDKYKALPNTVRSQIKKSVALYRAFYMSLHNR